MTYPIGMDERGIFFANIGLKYFPSTLIFRPDGTISCVRPGSLGADDLVEERRVALLDSDALDVTPPAPSPSPT